MNLGEMLRAKLMMTQYTEATTPKVEELKPKGKLTFPITNNLNRVLFEHIKHNPGNRKKLVADMVSRDYKYGSVTTLISQMIRQGLLQADNAGVLHLTVAEYTPLKNVKTVRKMEAAQKQSKLEAAQKRREIKVSVRNRTVGEVREERPVSSVEGVQETRVKSILRSLSILEALELYAELKKVFGDNK
jgi:hypothetical protein